MNTISYMKGNQWFFFRYEKGSEAQVLEALADMVVYQPELKFDWFDAATVSYQLGQHLIPLVKDMMRGK